MLRFCLSIVLCAVAAAEAVAGAPTIVSGSAAIAGNEVDVRKGLVQMELAPGIVASAGDGTRFSFDASGQEERELVVLTGVVHLVDVPGGRTAQLTAGTYTLGAGAGLDLAKAWQPGPFGEESRGVLISDHIWARQGEVLLIPTQPLVQGLFGAINQVTRSLFNRPAR